MNTSSPIFLPSVMIAVFYAVSLTGELALAQATTDPVGFIDLSVSGAVTAGASKISLISPTLTKPVLWQGAITGISGTTITVGNAPWTANQFNGAAGSHYVEIVSAATPAISGTLADITATTTSTITTFTATGAAIGDTVKIRKDVTISDLFGATNSAGLLASGGDATTADEVLIYSGGVPPVSYFYYTGSEGFPAGWYNSVTFDPAGSTVIAPHEAVVIKRKAVGDLTISFSGAVKTGNTLIPILNGLNVLGTASAKGLTLDTSGLYTGNNATGVLPSSGDATTADEIILYSPTAPPTSYFYYTGSEGFPAGWYNSVTFSPAGTVAIAPGTAFVLKRKTGAAFNWALPSPTSF